jgi:hypothetical protein
MRSDDVPATEVVSQAAVAQLRGELAALRTELAALRAHLTQLPPAAGAGQAATEATEAPVLVTTDMADAAAPVAAGSIEAPASAPADVAGEASPVTTGSPRPPFPRRRYTAELVLLGLVLIGAVTALAIVTRSNGDDADGGGIAEGEVVAALAPQADLRSFPPWDDRSVSLRQVPAGTALRLTGRAALELDAADGLLSTWWPVVVEGTDDAGYVREDFLVNGALPAGTPPALAGPVAVVTDVVPLYDAPARAAQPIASLKPGAQLRVTGPAEQRGLSYTWWPVTVEATDQTGYIEAAFVGSE